MARTKLPWSRRAPQDGPFDAIVIGSGMGGMTAAAMLTELGKRVLVLEQHYLPGGFTHTFSRKGWTWDVGVHAVGEVTEHAMTGRLLKRLTGGALQWAPLGEVYDEFEYPQGFRIGFPDSPEKLRRNLVDAFPGEEKAIDGYLDLVREVAGAMKGYYLSRAVPRWAAGPADLLLGRRAATHLERTTEEVVEGLTDDPRLRALFAAQWGYYGSVPSRSSFAIQALVVKHFQWGGFYPVGGSGRIAETLLKRVADGGGWTRIFADVEEILVDKGRVDGVRLHGGEVIRAPLVISAAGVGATTSRLLPAELRDTGEARELAALKPASAHVCLYLGFEGDIREQGCSARNQWFYETWDMEDDVWAVDPALDRQPRASCLYCSFPSLKDPEHDPGPKQRHTGEVVTFVPWDVFEPWRATRWGKRGEDYDAFKQTLQDALLEQFLSHLPGLRDKVKWVELSTPLSTDHFCRPQRGSIYGLEPTPDRFRARALRPHSPVKGLFYGGSEVATVGVIGAMMGGVLATMAAEPRGSMRLLRSLSR